MKTYTTTLMRVDIIFLRHKNETWRRKISSRANVSEKHDSSPSGSVAFIFSI